MINDLHRHLSVFGVIMLAACATTAKSPEPSGAGTEPQAIVAVAPPKPDYTSAEVQRVAAALRNYAGTLYSVVRDEYTLYIGGQLTATIHGANGELTLTPDGETAPSCSYDSKGQLAAKADKTNCDRLLAVLDETVGSRSP